MRTEDKKEVGLEGLSFNESKLGEQLGAIRSQHAAIKCLQYLSQSIPLLPEVIHSIPLAFFPYLLEVARAILKKVTSDKQVTRLIFRGQSKA